MSAETHLEVVQTEDGEVLLRRSDAGNGEPLVVLRFSPEIRAMLGTHLNDVALAMFGAGLQATSQVARQVAAMPAPPVLH
ncbi:MAG: hypothetical protein K0R03_1658 [Moraxellaceae bacterium]|jgi:hypothetical protein|nr:hypothetical protein [Moraxellaceae bacterium]MDF3031100.1 hypothetical protein [Moraxellaceae bacterium]